MRKKWGAIKDRKTALVVVDKVALEQRIFLKKQTFTLGFIEWI